MYRSRITGVRNKKAHSGRRSVVRLSYFGEVPVATNL